jgi:hypothetical protein
MSNAHQRNIGPDPSLILDRVRRQQVHPLADAFDSVRLEQYVDRLGWSMIPLRAGDKRPIFDWGPYRYRKPKPSDWQTWVKRFPEANLGLITGRLSGVVVLDVDDMKLGAEIAMKHPATGPMCATPGGGFHMYFKYPKDRDIPNSSNRKLGCDLRGEGGYVVLPPSVDSRGRWKWDLDPLGFKPPPLRKWVLDLFPTLKG